MEDMRKSIMYDAVLKATSDLSDGDRKALADAYRHSLMPRGKVFSTDKSERSLEAIRKQKRKNAEYAKDPYIEPTVILPLELDSYSKFEGMYSGNGKQTIRIYSKNGSFLYQRGKDDPKTLFPVSDFLFTFEDRKSTIEFLPDENGVLVKAEIRRERQRTMRN